MVWKTFCVLNYSEVQIIFDSRLTQWTIYMPQISFTGQIIRYTYFCHCDIPAAKYWQGIHIYWKYINIYIYLYNSQIGYFVMMRWHIYIYKPKNRKPLVEMITFRSLGARHIVWWTDCSGATSKPGILVLSVTEPFGLLYTADRHCNESPRHVRVNEWYTSMV